MANSEMGGDTTGLIAAIQGDKELEGAYGPLIQVPSFPF